MMERTLIVARFRPGATDDQVAKVFARSDETDLPARAGVRARTLFRFHDLYFHLIESEEPAGPAVEEIRNHPLFKRISSDLEPYIAPYDPETWKAPKDAMARDFYRWAAP